MWLKIGIITENKHVNKYTCSKRSIEAKRNSYLFLSHGLALANFHGFWKVWTLTFNHYLIYDEQIGVKSVYSALVFV